MAKWIKSTESITFEVADRVARIDLDRPDKRNALSPSMLEELEAALLEADDRTDVHVILLGGHGKDFCAGYDPAGAYAGFGGGAATTTRTYPGRGITNTPPCLPGVRSASTSPIRA